MNRRIKHSQRNWRISGLALALALLTQASVVEPVKAQATWVGDVPDGTGGFSDLWRDCLPCDSINDPPNTGWSNDRIPGFDGPLGDPGASAVIGPDGSVDLAGGAMLSLSDLTVNGFLNIGGKIEISGTASLSGFNIESGGGLDASGPVTFSGSGTWNGFLEGTGGFTNAATLTSATGDLRGSLTNNANLIVSPSLVFGGAPGMLINSGIVSLNSTLDPNGNANILDNSNVGNIRTSGSIVKNGSDLSVIEAAGEQTGGTISASEGVLRFFRGGWLFSGGNWSTSNDGQIELTGNVDHEIGGVSGISGQGSLRVNMNSFGTLTVSSPFTVDLQPSFSLLPHGLILEGLGMFVDAPVRTLRGGRWLRGTLSGGGSIINQAPETDPFLILPNASKVLDTNFRNEGHVQNRDSIRVELGSEFFNAAPAELVISNPESNVNWTGSGRLRNAGTVRIVERTDVFMDDVRFDQRDQAETEIYGRLFLRGGGMWTGKTGVRLLNESLLVFEDGLFTFDSGIHQINGRVFAAINGATLEVGSGASLEFGEIFTSLDAGFIGGQGTIISQGTFQWRGGTFGVGGQSDFRNEGLLRVESGLRVLSGTITNNDRMDLLSSDLSGGELLNLGEVNCFGSSSVSTAFDNQGVLTVDGGARCEFTGSVAQISPNGVLSGGIWNIETDATLILPAHLTTIGAGAVVNGLEGLDDAEGLAAILGGRTSVTGDLPLFGSLELANGGRLEVGGAATLEAPGGIENGNTDSVLDYLTETLSIARGPQVGPMIMTSTLTNWARIGPGGESSPGPFNLTGDLVMQPTATLEIDLGGHTPITGHDRVDVIGGLIADGTVRIEVLDGFFPVVGDEFAIATATDGVSGVFTGIEPANRPDIDWQLTETANEVTLRVLDVEILFAGGFEG